MVCWCGVVPRLWASVFPFRVRRLDWVRPTVSVRCLVAVVCFGMSCCVVLCFAVLRCAALRCAVQRPTLLCRAVPCLAVVCLAVAWRVAPCCAAPCCVLLCCVVSWGALSRSAGRRCAVLRCAVLRLFLPCFAVSWCVVGPSYLRSRLGSRGRLWGWLLCCVGRGLRLCGWPVAGERGLTWCGSLGPCCRGLDVPLGLVSQAGLCGVALPWGLCLGLVSSGGLCHYGRAGFCAVGWRGPLRCVGSPSILSLCPRVVPRLLRRGRVPFPLRCACCCVCVVALAVAGVVSWRLGSLPTGICTPNIVQPYSTLSSSSSSALPP